MTAIGSIRPELVRGLSRWREVAAGIVATVLGLYWVATSAGVFWLLGVALSCAGGLTILAGVQRARFRRAEPGPGVVQLAEGQLAYFGPETGGVVAIRDVTRVELATESAGTAWILSREPEPPLTIPVGAAGAEALFDVFARLPGIETETMLRKLHEPGAARVTIWEKERTLIR